MTGPVAQLFQWLSDQALPFWATHGVDHVMGGFYERANPDGSVVGDVRRARLVARQIYAFRVAGELGWSGDALPLCSHGVTALLDRHISKDGLAISCFTPTTEVSSGTFDLYDQAFVLFGLANGARVMPGAALEARAQKMVSRMRDGLSHSLGGFIETNPVKAPLKANPHMHLFEAALSWMEVSNGADWSGLADEIAELCLSHFLDQTTGALHEFFDTDWKILRDPPQDVVEPGHQAEWSWLLMRWAIATGQRQRFEPFARRLFAIAESNGRNARQDRLVNELDAQLAVRWGHMRLWPQTERIKALVLLAETTPSPSERSDLTQKISGSVSAMLDYFDHPVRGCWWEHLDPQGQPVAEQTRASSLYHIIGAAAELARFTGAKLN